MNFFTFQWHITDSCDQRCKHCYIFSEDNNVHIIEMNFSNARKVFENCIHMCSNSGLEPYFTITGGDPILHSDFWEILGLFKSHDISFSILGNPFHLTPEVCSKLKEYGCDSYQLSIDGMKATHDMIRKPGSFDTTIEKIKVIRDAGMECSVMTTVSGTNIKEIPEIVDIVVNNNVDVFGFARYCPTSLEKSTHITPDEYRDFLGMIWDKYEQYKNSNTTFNLKDHLWTLFLYEKGLFEIDDILNKDTIYDGCHCAGSHLTILPNGDVMACRRFESRIGNALHESLYDIFNGTQIKKFREYERFDKCRNCELLRFCRGCPAVAYGYYHDFYAPDPQCWKANEHLA